MANKFKVGDVVKCVVPDRHALEKGAFYTVMRLPHPDMVVVSEIEGWWDASRFITAHERTFNQQVTEIIDKITYKPGWKILHGQDNGRSYLQVSVDCFAEASMDSVKRDGSRTPWKGGKRYLSPHMCRQEIVGVCFDLIKAAEMHEVHEWFRYKGASIFNPHLDPDVLADVAKKASSFNVRKNAMSMDEDGGTS